MQLETLDYLLAIADSGSTRKAAERLCTSFQNVSRVLLATEEEWGVQLFARTSKGMTPTAEGERALATAREVRRLYDEMLADFQSRQARQPEQPNQKISGRLELTSSVLVNNAFLNDVLVEFSLQYPKINIDLSEEDAYLVQDHTKSRIALAPRICTDIAQVEDALIPLLKDRVALLVRRGSAFDRQGSISLKRMAQLPLVLVTRQEWEQSAFGHILAAHHLEPANATYTSSIPGFQKYVASGQYAGLSTDIISRKLLSSNKQLDLKIIPIRERNVDIYYCLAINDRDHLTDVEHCFIDFLKDTFHLDP